MAGTLVEFLSEVLKILDGALKANATMASSYAGLLAEKLESAGEREQATLVRQRLIRAPKALASAQDASSPNGTGQLPVDGESRLHTIDYSRPTLSDVFLALPTGVERRVEDLLDASRHYDVLAKAGAAVPPRLLIYGPPGTGKTQTAHWIAANLGLPLLTVRCDTLISSMLGQTSKNLRRVFEYAQSGPSVLFLDEVDALASARGNERDVGELQRVVVSLLQNIDALEPSTVVVAATNHDRLLDPAVWRRFAFQLPMPLPDAGLREELWRRYLSSFGAPTLDYSALAKQSKGATGSLIEQVSLDAKRHAVLARQPVVDEGETYRRLALAMALMQGETLTSVDNEVRWLRKWDARRFSVRELARLYGVTTRKINNIVKEIKEDAPPDEGAEAT
ncbi:ATP-binding protein [Stenotrophomonas maltophilia]|uniref:anti-phage ATPase IteA n=1 Tax=Stenotrophomonas maltophilia TaxID=40324 RepID=UPI00209A7570|nr:anti-phage ATPase IteA [Stenotrophomonas maltophilia]MCO7500262.1 ATP-binding protein [Stenotrophomonas maltophilia]